MEKSNNHFIFKHKPQNHSTEKQAILNHYIHFCGSLCMLNNYSRDDKEVQIQYAKPEQLTKIAELYHLKDIIDNTSTFTKCLSLMNYQTKHMLHNGYYDNHIKDGILAVLEYAWDSNREKSVNCLWLAKVLRTFMQSQGIKARLVGMYPLTPYEQENHIVVEAWLEEEQKWVMFDPTSNTYVLDEQNTLLNLAEIRTALGAQKPISFSPTTAYNHKPRDLNTLKAYYAKNCFLFTFMDNQTGKEQPQEHNIIIAPDGFDYEKYASIRKFYTIQTIYKPLSFMSKP